MFATAGQVVLDPPDAPWDAEDDRGEATSSSRPKANVFLSMRCPRSDEDYILEQLRDFCAESVCLKTERIFQFLFSLLPKVICRMGYSLLTTLVLVIPPLCLHLRYGGSIT